MRLREEELAVVLSAYGFTLGLLNLEPYSPVPKRKLVEIADTMRVVLRLGRTNYSELVDRLVEENILVEQNGFVQFNFKKIEDDPELVELFNRAGNIATRLADKLKIRLARMMSGEYGQYVAN